MSSTDGDHLAPPRAKWVDPQAQVPLSPPARPPFQHYHSSTSLPITPRTPFPAHPSTTPPPALESSSRLKPYLTLPPRLLLVFLTPAILPLILTLVHLFQNRSSTASLADSLRSSLLSACDGLAHGAASIQSLPRYLAMQTNQEVVRATQASILAVGVMLIDSVTIIETVVTFIVDTYRSMLLCTIELAVRGTLEVLIDAVKTISDGITNSLNSLRSNIQNDIGSANSVIQSAVDKINSVTSKVNININVPQFSIPSLDALQNVQIPTTFEDSLIKLNTTLPTLSELKDKMNQIIDKPFELLKAEINETRLEMAKSFNDSSLPVPSLHQLSADKSNGLQQELCGDLDTSLIDDTAKALHKLSTVAIGLMFLLIILIWAALCIWEWRKWKVLKDTVDAVEVDWKRDEPRDAWRVVAIVEHPVLEGYGRRVFDRFRTSKTTEVNVRWYLAYLSHPTCLALLLVSLLGFLSLQFQIIALDAVKSHARANANSTVEASTNSLATKLNSYALETSQQYADNFNAAILAHQDRINNEMFGSWLNTTAITLNDTLVNFYDEVEHVLNVTFGGTIIYGPINTFLYCILGSKITNLEKGLTWVSEHAHVTLPTLPPDVLLLSNSSMDEMAQPVAAAAVGGGGDTGDEGIVGSLISHYESALVFERNFYAILLGLWLAFSLVGLCVVLWNSRGRDRYVAWRGERPTDGGAGPGSRAGTPMLKWLPWAKEADHPIYEQNISSEKQGLPPVPRIVEPDQDTSYMDYSQARGDEKAGGAFHSTPRPFAPRKGTFGSTISSLAAPGQAFLKLSRWGSTDNIHLPDNSTNNAKNNLVNGSSETYSAQRDLGMEHNGDDRSEVGEGPQLWVNKWYRAVDSAKSMFPSRGQRHGQALGATKPDGQTLAPAQQRGFVNLRDSVPEWTMADSPIIGRDLDGLDGLEDDGGRYPRPAPSHTQGQGQGHTRSLTATASSSLLPPSSNVTPSNSYDSPSAPRLPSETLREEGRYPRRMSRAPTIGDGAPLSTFNPFDVPAVPPQTLDKEGQSGKHDSVDYLEEDQQHGTAGGGGRHEYRGSYLPYAEDYHLDDAGDYPDYADTDASAGADEEDAYHRDYRETQASYTQDRQDPFQEGREEVSGKEYGHSPQRREELLSPVSSSGSTSYFPNEAHVESVSRVQTGTAALASILQGMKDKKSPRGPSQERVGNPFRTPFDEARGGRI